MKVADVVEALGVACLVMAAAIAVGAAAALAVCGLSLVAKSFELDIRSRRPSGRRPTIDPTL